MHGAPLDPLDAANPSQVTIVGIGASAGGLKALQQFVGAVPEDSGSAYVVIIHLDPERESRMAELLQNQTPLPVTQVTAPQSVEANHFYIIPPGWDLTMDRTTLSVRERGERSDHAPVDLFFRTLAEAYGPEAIGVVLSGTGSDGASGIRFIREAGGITVAQSPDEADYPGMPTAAITTGLVDLVLPSAQIPAELIRLRRFPSPLSDGDGEKAETEAGLAEVFTVLRARTGHDFSLYKRSTVLRRLSRRLRFNGVTTLKEYVPLLRARATECQSLLRDLLISVSGFFRDPASFEALAALMPALFAGKRGEDTVRVWVVGCATGEEVYSLAMVLTEYADTLADPPRIQMFATDIDEKGYAWGREALYTAAAVASIQPERLRRFFSQEAGGYRVTKALREQVLFAVHNVLHDPPFSRMDLISCRNLFIYLQPDAQQQVLETFHYALNSDGLLFLGGSESAGDSGLFTPVPGTKGQRLFRRSVMAYPVMPRLSSADPLPRRGSSSAPKGAGGDPLRKTFSYGALHVRMLEQYAPASVVVDARLDVVHLSDRAGRFLRLREGEPSRNLMDLARDDLRTVLRAALHQAFQKGKASTRSVRLMVDGDERQVDVQVRPSTADGDAGKFALIVFAEASDPVTVAAPAAPRDPAERHAVAMLEEELRRTREQLDLTNAAHDRTVAELQTVNEELLSINEEQKAATQELETGREEIQSINEELTTINQEHQSTIEELKRTNADLHNLIESTEIGTIFLDPAMRIRRFTPAVHAIFNFVASDQGRSFAHITHRLHYPELVDDVARVLATLERVEREVGSDSGESYIVRINPYRSHDGGNEGAVLTFFNNTAQYRAAQELAEAKTAAESANRAKGTFMATLSHEFRTPLNAILGYADLLHLFGPLTGAQEDKVARIKAGGWHLVAMLNEILSFARLDGGHEVIVDDLLDARELAREAKVLTEPAADEKGLAFILELPAEAVELTTDGGKARQILINLCGNAVKYTATGEIRLRVRAEPERVIFEVRDTGIGIAAEHHERIFERFWQVDGGLTRSVGGLGMGLAAAREYSRLLGGDVEVESTGAEGSLFRLWLPQTKDSDSTNSPA